MGISPKILRLLLVFSSVAFVQYAYAQDEEEDDTIKFRCGQEAINLQLYKRAIQSTVLAQIDPATYSEPSVTVSFRKITRDASKHEKTSDEITTGLTLTRQGLGYSAAGTLRFSETCEFTYLARIKVSAVEISTGVKLTTATESTITIQSTGEVSIKGKRTPR